MSEGEPAMAMCVIEEGTVEVRKNDKMLGRLSKGDFFGELSVRSKDGGLQYVAD